MTDIAHFTQQSDDPDANFKLGKEYEAQGQNSAAMGFYLRAAERSTDAEQQYHSLLRMYFCLEKQNLSMETRVDLLNKAINTSAQRPEAYFLLARLYEWQQKWQDSYDTAERGCLTADFSCAALDSDVQYPGAYALYFQKGVAAWWTGRHEESREIMYDLKINHVMNDLFVQAVERNISSIGLPSRIQPSDQSIVTADAPLVIPDRTLPRDIINPHARSGAWIVDDFLRDPDAIRQFALAQEYQINHDGEQGYIGTRTIRQFLFPGMREEFERIIGRRIVRWEEHGMNGRFQICQAGDPLVYHCDDQTWAGMLYLTPNAPYQCGTSTYARKGTDIRHRDHPDIMSCFLPGSRHFDRTIFEPVDVFGNVYNRLVIFDAGYLHSASEYFGFNNENSRLWQMFFFD